MDTGVTTHKFVAVLNTKIPVNLLMNALGHMAAGLAASYPNVSDLRLDAYVDQSGGVHKNISDHPFIVLAADNSNQLCVLRRELAAAGVHFVDFTSTMTVGTFEEQKERTKNTPEDQLEYYGVCMFGEKGRLNALTKKFSLWK